MRLEISFKPVIYVVLPKGKLSIISLMDDMYVSDYNQYSCVPD